MPVLNVDEELIAYGAGVSQTLRNMRNLSKNAGLDASYRQATDRRAIRDGTGSTAATAERLFPSSHR